MSLSIKSLIVLCAIFLAAVVLWALGPPLLKLPRIDVPPVYDASEATGAVFCIDLAQESQRFSLLYLLGGWVLILGAVVLLAIGSLLGPDPAVSPNDKGWKPFYYTYRGFLFSLLGVTLAGLGWQSLSRSNALTVACSAATEAIVVASEADGDWRAYQQCVAIQANWIRSRSDHRQLTSLLTRSGVLSGQQLPRP